MNESTDIIDNYSLQDLLDLFSLDESFTVDELNNSLIKLLKRYSALGEQKYIFFLKSAREKLLEYNKLNTHDTKKSVTDDDDESSDNEENKSNNNDMEVYDSIILKNEYLPQDDEEKEDIFNYTYKKGKLNPLRKQTRTINLNINSLFRKNYYDTLSTDFLYTLPTQIKNVVSMQVASFEMPNMAYTFSSRNKTNEFTINTYDVSGNDKINLKSFTIDIADGIYSINEIVSYLNDSIFQSNPNSELNGIMVIFNSIKGSIQFMLNPDNILSANARFDIDFRLKDEPLRPIQLNMGWLLGFRKPYYSYDNDYKIPTSVNTYQPEGFAGESHINIVGTKYFLLHINDFNNNKAPVYETLFQEGLIQSNDIMDKIINTGGKSLIHTNLSGLIHKKRCYFGPTNIEKLEIKLFDEFGRIVDLNNSDISLTLELEIIYNL